MVTFWGGKERLERGRRYYDALGGYYGQRVHTRSIVEGVGRDHSLMWTSAVGLGALFGKADTTPNLLRDEVESFV